MRRKQRKMATGTNMTKEELRKFIHDVIDSDIKNVNKKVLPKEEVKDMIRETLVGLFKYLWQKSSTYVNQI